MSYYVLVQYSSRVFAYFHAPPRWVVEWQNAVATVKQVFHANTWNTAFYHRDFPPVSLKLTVDEYTPCWATLSTANRGESRWTLLFAEIVWTSVIYVLLLIFHIYIYIFVLFFLYFRFEEQTNKDACILEIALQRRSLQSMIWK